MCRDTMKCRRDSACQDLVCEIKLLKEMLVISNIQQGGSHLNQGSSERTPYKLPGVIFQG